MIVIVITSIINPDLKEVMEGMKSELPDQMNEVTGMNKVWEYIVNNGFAVPLQMFVFAIIPVQFLYFINIIMTVSLPGVLYGISLQENVGQGIGILISSIPHYIVEVFALCLFAAVLFEFNQMIYIFTIFFG